MSSFLQESGINLSYVTKQSPVTIRLKTKTGASILEKDMPTARKIVNSESLLNLSKVKSVPSKSPTGKAFPRIFGSS